MIWNYGLHWHVDRVWWGRPNKPGVLYGATTRNALEENVVDFREQIGIYALYADYELVYVGQAGTGNFATLFARLRDHRSDHLSERWNRFSWFCALYVNNQNKFEERNTVLGEFTGKYNDGDVQTLITSYMNIVEAVSIAISEPRLNLRRGRWNYEQVTQYYQWRDPQWSVE